MISTKAGYDMWPGPYGEGGGTRKYVLASLDQSLARMGLEYVDIFYSHRFDPDTPLEETIGALDTAVRQGKALYAGISSYSPEKTREAAAIGRSLGTPIVIHQPSYSMLNRWIEPELLDTLEAEGIGCIGFSPLAQGVLTDRYLDGIPEGSRAATEGTALSPNQLNEQTLAKVRALNEIAAGRGQTLAAMALAWTLRDPRMTSTLVGASSVAQLEANVAALDNLDFTDEELAEIDQYATESDINLWAASSESADLLLARAVVAVLGVALAQEARELGGERVAGREVLVLLEVELVGAPLELGDVGRGLLVGRDRLGHLLGVRLLRLRELRRVDLDPEQLPEPVAERAGGARARRERDVVRHRRPQARGRHALAAAAVLEDADDPGRPLVAGVLQPEALDERRVARRARHGRRTRVRHVREQRAERDHELDVEVAGELDHELREGLPAQARLDAEEQDRVAIGARDPGVVEGVLRPVDPPRHALRRARRAAGSPGSRRTPRGRCPPKRSACHTRAR